jgi:hypothetical protein
MHAASLRVGLGSIRHPWLIAVLLGVFVFLFVQFTAKVSLANHDRSAFLRWRTQLIELDDGVNVWDKYAYPNPPIMAILLKPFMILPPTLGSSLWFACKVLFALASILGVWTFLDAPERTFSVWGKALGVLLALRPIEGDLIHGNVNLLILLLVVGTLIAFCQRRDILAGALLGLGIACKLTPALFLVYFLYKRAWKTLLGAFGGLLVFGLLLPAAVYGWNANLEYLHSWHQQMVAPYAAGVISSEHKNQSLPGVLHRLLSDEASFSDYVGEQKVVLETHNIASLTPETVQGIVLACMAAFALAAAWYCRTPIGERPPLPMTAEFSVVVLGMLLFCERTWKHHCVTLLLPFCVLAYGLGNSGFSRRMRWYYGATLGLAGLLMLSTSTGFDQDRIGKLSQVYGAYVWTFLLLLPGMFVILRKTIQASRAPSGAG